MVGRFIADPNPESGQIWTAQQLASVYADIANREPIQAATMEAMGVNWMPSYFARVLPNTQIIEISVSDTIPERAQIFAAELANQVISYTPTDASFTGTGANRQEFIESQLDLLQIQIIRTQNELEALQQKLGDLNSAREIADTNSKIQVFESKLFSLQSAYADLLSNTQEGASNTIQLLEPANLPRRPVGPNKLLIVLPALLIGAVLAGGAAYLLEYLNNSLDTVSDIQRELPVPLLGEVPRLPRSVDSWTHVDKDPISIYAEAFRKLRTNIEISTKDRPVSTILVSSAAEGDGKSTVVANLAITYSYLGKKVVIVDADFRRHRIHEVFGLQKEPGLTEILSETKDISDAIQHWKDNVYIISSGKFLNNSTELISSQKFLQMINELKRENDLVIIDGPPFFLSETSALSTVVNGLLLVVPVGSSKDVVRQMKKQLDMIQSPILGIVANQVKPATYYGYYYAGYADDPKERKRSSLTSLLATLANGFSGGLKGLNKSVNSSANTHKATTAQDLLHTEMVEEKPVKKQPTPKKEFVTAKPVPKSSKSGNFLFRAILNRSEKSVEEDKKQLQDLARKKKRS